MSGYIYFATNSAMPGLTKIGFTETVLSERFAALQSTGVPAPFELYAAFRVDDARACESAIHGVLANRRFSDNREFFRIAAKDAVSHVLPHLLSHTMTNHPEGQLDAKPFSDLDDMEQEILAAYTMAPSGQRPQDWEWVKRMFGMDELDSRFFFNSLKVKGYLREIRGSYGAILYDLTPRGVTYGRIARKDPKYIELYGDEKAFYRARIYY